jgi:hypothetical protein
VVRKNALASSKRSDEHRVEKMSNKAQSVQTRLVQLGFLLVMLFFALPLIPHATAQRNGAGALPIGNCDGSPFWDQYDNAATEPPVGIGSQMFEPGMAAFDNQAADGLRY